MKRFIVALLVFGLIGLPACGGSDDSGSDKDKNKNNQTGQNNPNNAQNNPNSQNNENNAQNNQSGDNNKNNTQNNQIDEQALQQAKEAHSKYQDISKAIKDGYMGPAHYEVHPEGVDKGAMGVHLANRQQMQKQPDPQKASILVYDLNKKGEYELAGLEWFMSAEKVDEAPKLFGQKFDGPMEGHTPDQPEHYDLHAWLYKDNPAGQFAAWNTNMEPPSFAEDLGKLVEATNKYMKPAKAKEDGYERAGECTSHPEKDTAMGVHFMNESIEGIELQKPNVLVYVPTGEGLRLAAAEYFVPVDAAGDEAPTLMGQTFHGPMEGHEEGQPEHYELHVWTHMPNPNGLFAQWNPAVSCPDTSSEEADSSSSDSTGGG